MTVDIEDNVLRSSYAVPLAIHTFGRPVDPNKPIPREVLMEHKKLLAEAGPKETKILLGWYLDTRNLLISLPDHKHIAWKRDLLEMLE